MNSKLRDIPCYCATLRQAARAITSIYEDAFVDSGLHSTQYTILQLLHAAGALGTSELAATLGVDQTTATRMLALVNKEGLITPRAEADRRRKRWFLTAEGELVLNRLKPAWDAAQCKVEKLLGRSHAISLRQAAHESAAKMIRKR